jgi:hypothetical protein
VTKTESIIATLEILADRKLASRLLKLDKTIDDDLAADHLLRTEDVFLNTEFLTKG